MPDSTSNVAQYNTKTLLNYCFPASIKSLPDNFKEGWTSAKAAFLTNPIGKYFNDLYLSSRAIYISFAMSLVYSLALIYLMSAFAETIAWICVALAQAGFIFGAVLSYYHYVGEKANFE